MEITEYRNKEGRIIDVDDVKEKYFAQWKIKNIAEWHNCSCQQIGKIVWKEIPSRRPRKYKYDIYHEYFNDIDTEEKAYILGFLCADGCVSKRSPSLLSIALQARDREMLEKIKRALKSESPIEDYVYKDKPYCRIHFYSKHLCDTLRTLGCVSLKSMNLKWNREIIHPNLMRHFLRGYFDGDGHFSFWMYKGKYLKSHFNVTSTMNFCKGFSAFIRKLFGYSFYMSQRHKGSGTNNRTIELSGNKQITSIMKWLYDDATIFLGRKKFSFDEFQTAYA